MNWILPGVVLVLAVLTAITILVRGRGGAEENTAETDSWEVAAERRRRKERAYASASYLLLFCCAAVAAALSFHGLVGFGRQNLGLSGGWEYLVPFGLDGAAMFCAVIAVREASHGDASVGSRLLVWLFAGAAAWFNWVHAPRGADHAGAPEFFAGMSLSAAILFDRALKQTRKSALREQGLVPRPLPQIRAVRWLRAPRETYGAWSLMLLEGVRTLDEAVEEVRDERRRKDEERLRKRERSRLERAQLRAVGGPRHAGLRSRYGRRLAVTAGQQPAGELPSGESTGVESGGVPVRPRAALGPAGEDAERPGGALTPVGGGTSTVDDDNPASGRLDTLEEKLRAIERQFG